MVLLRKEEAHSHLFEELHAACRALIDVDAQRFQTIRRSAEGGSCAVAVLGHLHAAGSSHKRGGGGNVEAVGIVAACADDFKNIHAGVHLGGVIAHGSGTAGNFVSGFRSRAFGGKCREERGVLCGSGLAAHNLVHDSICLVICEIAFAYDFDNGFFDHGCISPFWFEK